MATNNEKYYYVNYGTGAGDFAFAGTLAEVKEAADKGVAYTQTNVEIYELDKATYEKVTASKRLAWKRVCEAMVDPLMYRKWQNYGSSYGEKNAIDFGRLGHYSDWEYYGA